MTNLADEQWCVLDLLMRAREKGVTRLNRIEMLHSPDIPQTLALKLTWAALTMPSDLVTWHGQHDFSITDKGVQLFTFRFEQPTAARQTTSSACPAHMRIGTEPMNLPWLRGIREIERG